jgi:glycosyltransferase involved in cell wall biosynthesis
VISSGWRGCDQTLFRSGAYNPDVRIAIDCRKAADFGIGRYIRGLTHALAALPGEERFLLLAPPSLHHLLPGGDRFTAVDCTASGYGLRELFAVPAAAKRGGATLLHSPHYVVPFSRIPKVVTIHDLIHLHQLKGLRNAHRIAYARWMLSRATIVSRAILTVSESVRREIEQIFPAARGKVTVTPNGIDDEFSSPLDEKERAAIARRVGVTGGEYFLFVGNDKPHKNLETLVSAFGRRAPALAGHRLVLAGARPERFAQLEGVVLAGHLTDRELHALYAGSTALLLPSLEEGWGLPLAEAMASGAAVIASDLPVLREVSGGAALHVDARDPDALAAAMLELGSSAQLQQDLRARGKKRASTLSWEATAKKTLELYRSVV